MLNAVSINNVPMQRAFGRGECFVKMREDATHLERLWQEGCAKIRLPKHAHGFEAVMINSSGGLTGGDRLNWRFLAAACTSMTVTTQACEKVYAASQGVAEVSTELECDAGSRLNWLPQETILFNHAALSRTLKVNLAADAELLLCEPVLFGREAMHETVHNAVFKDKWRIFRDGALLHAEQTGFGPDCAVQAAQKAVMNGARALATTLLISADAEALLPRAHDIVGDDGGVSFWNGKLLARIVSKDGYRLRQRLMPLLSLLNKRAALPKCWSL